MADFDSLPPQLRMALAYANHNWGVSGIHMELLRGASVRSVLTRLLSAEMEIEAQYYAELEA